MLDPFIVDVSKSGVDFINTEVRKSVYFQPGDDAAAFMRELEDYRDTFTELTDQEVLYKIWLQYDHIAEEF